MNSPEKGAFSLKLGHQGLLLVFVLLVIEFGFVGGLFHLLNQAEQEARREEHLRKIITATNRLIELNYVAVYAVRDFVATKDSFHERKYLRAIDETKMHLDWLERNLQSEPYQLELIKRIRTKFNVAFDVADKARDVISGGGSLFELTEIMKSKGEFHQLNRQLVPDFQDLLRSQRRIEEKSPVLQRKFREEAQMLLAGGMILNVVAVLVAALFFTRGIVKRLEVLVDNTMRLKQGENLHPVLKGNDEIARLDRAFHEMAFDLGEASRKERLALADAKEAEARIRQVINSMPSGLLIADRSGTILFANPRAASMLAYDASDLKGMNFFGLVPDLDVRDEGSGLTELHEELADKSIETRATRSNQVELDIDLSVTPFDSKGDKRFLITMIDITEKLEIQRMRQAFVAMVSHELRTPLNSVQGYLELLDMGVFGTLSDEAQDGAHRAAGNIDRLIMLINDLLDLEKIESGTISLDPSERSINEAIERSIASVHDLAERKRISIVASQNRSAVAYFDQDRVVQVLVNLLSNALKFTPEGGQLEIIVDPKIYVSTKYGDMKQLEISVIDQGPGVPPRYREIIFERFQQVRSEESQHKGGTGLGLAICKAIVEQHGGSIGVDCDGETGSRFWFRLPVTEDHFGQRITGSHPKATKPDSVSAATEIMSSDSETLVNTD